MNQTKKGLKKQKSKDIKKEKTNKLKEILTINIISSLSLFVICSILINSLFNSDKENTNIGLLLAIISLLISIIFEIYEWYRLITKKDKISTIPFMIADFFLVIFVVLKEIFPYLWNNLIEYTNIICAVTLLLYIILLTIRIITINLKQN